MENKRWVPGEYSGVRLIAHRGFTPVAPQNSIPAFMEAGKRRFWAIETDVHRTADGHLVCIHDATVDSTYKGSGAVREMTLKELLELERVEEEGLKIPLFSEYLRICRQAGAVPFIETKTEDIPQILEETAEWFRPDEIVMSSTKFHHLEMVRKLTEDIFIHHIFSDEDYAKQLKRMGKSGLSYKYSELEDVPEGLIERTHEQGICVCLRAGDNPETVRRMLEMGLDYIPTNRAEPSSVAERD